MKEYKLLLGFFTKGKKIFLLENAIYKIIEIVLIVEKLK